ncbi:MAG: cell division protein ZapA [Pseudomonadota bacterium]
MSQQVAVNIKVLDKQFQIGCREDEKDKLLASAQLLNENMQSVRNSGVLGTDRIAIMAALNLTREVISLREQAGQSADLGAELDAIAAKIDEAIDSLK